MTAAGIFAVSLMLASATHAATSDWATSDGGRMRVVATPADVSGHVKAVLQIEPGPGWITYWREPGESGIPPQLTLPAGSKATIDTIGYPVPKLISLGNVHEVGYDAPISLPLDINAAGERKLDITAFIGVCKDICVPFQATMSVTLPPPGSSADAGDAAIVTDAAAALPQKPSADFGVKSHSLSPDGKTLSLHLTLPDAGDAIPQIYVTGPSGYVFFKQASASRSGRDVEVALTIGKLPKTYVVHGKSWGILVVNGSRAMETTLVME